MEKAKRKARVKKKRPAGRPRTWGRTLPAVRVPAELYARLERRVALLVQKGDMKNLSIYVRESLTKNLDSDDLDDRRARREKIKRLEAGQPLR